MNTFLSRIAYFIPQVHKQLSEILDREALCISRHWTEGRSVLNILKKYTLSGGGSRAALVSLGAEAFGAAACQESYCIGASLELLQSFLLIHDDIIDADLRRRGDAAMHVQLAAGDKKKGESRAICVGNIAAMLAFSLLAEAKLPPLLLQKILSLLGPCMAEVGMGEIMDIDISGALDVALEKVLEIYKVKTAHYSVTLPLSLGALYAGINVSQLSTLKKFSEATGLLFQIRDDELDIWGKDTGKPLGSDIRDRKPSVPLLLFRDRYGIDALAQEVLSVPFTEAASTLTSIQDLLSARKQALVQEAMVYLEQIEGLSAQGKEDFTALVNFAELRER